MNSSRRSGPTASVLFPIFPCRTVCLPASTAGRWRQQTRRSLTSRHIVPDAPWEALERYAEFARQRGITQTALALGWLLAQPAVATVIAGVTRPEQLNENLVATRWRPTAEEVAELERSCPRT